MIDRTHPLPVVRQCQLLKLDRSTAYYQPTPVSETTLAWMRRIDELHLQYPFAGARMLRDLLRQEGHAIYSNLGVMYRIENKAPHSKIPGASGQDFLVNLKQGR